MSDKNKITYKKLFRANVNFLGGHSVIRVADDHFLYSESNGYSEDYKRFFFADIQAVKLIKKRDWALLASLFMAALMMSLTILLVILSGSMETTVVMGVVTVSVAFVALYCIIAGNPVELKVITAYSGDKITIGRVRRTKKNLRKMISYIEAAQNNVLNESDLARLQSSEKTFKV